MTLTNDDKSNNNDGGDDDNSNNNNSLQQLQRQSCNPRYMAPTASSLAAGGPSTAAPPPAKFKSSISKRSSRNALSNCEHGRDAEPQTKYARVVEATIVGKGITDTDADQQRLSEMEELLKISDVDFSSVESTTMRSAHGPASTDAVNGPAAKTTFLDSIQEDEMYVTLKRDAKERLRKAKEDYLEAKQIALAVELDCQPKNRGENARQLREQENMMKQIRLLNEEDQNKDDDIIAGSELKSMLGASKEEEIRQLKKEIDNLKNAGIAHEDKILELEAIIVQSVLERKRPILTEDGEPINNGKTQSVVRFGDEQVAVANLKNPSQRHKFSFDRVFTPLASQEDVFSEVSELVQSALDGYDVCIFSYGQTGLGKTHTMQGAGSGDMRGLIPRCLEQIGLHKVAEEKNGWEFTMEVSFLEIYNESLKDLLRADMSQECRHEIMVGSDGRRTVTNLTVKVINPNNQAAVDDVLALAAKRRATGSTDMNATSSRSHSVFTLNITARHVKHNQVVRGTLNLVDLAGSERLDRSNAKGQAQKETVAINKSLSSLVDVFTAIGQKSSHVPFRNSKLTFLLQPALSGDGKTCMIVNLSPTEASVPETLCSLRFASKVKNFELGKAKQRIEDLNSETTDSKKNAGEGLEANNWVMKLFRPLTFEEQEIVTKATQGIGPPDEILASHDRDSVQRSSMQTLNLEQWINDEIINYFLKNCLAQRDEKLCAKQPGRKRSHFFSTFFVQKLFDEKNDDLSLRGVYNYKNVKRWSKKVPDKDIFKLKYIFCPINIDNRHWTTCAVIFMEEKRIQYYDSMGGTDMSKLKGLLQYLIDEYKAKNGEEMDASEWKLVRCTSDTPRQQNGFDCGVFTCMFCDFKSKDFPPVFNQEYIDHCRDRIALSIMKNCPIEWSSESVASKIMM